MWYEEVRVHSEESNIIILWDLFFPLRVLHSPNEDRDAGRDWGQEEKGTTEDEMAGWPHRLDGHEFE